MEQNRRRKASFLEYLLENKLFGSFFAKLCVFLAFGFGMNLVKDEAVCYFVLVVIVLAFCIKVVSKEGK